MTSVDTNTKEYIFLISIVIAELNDDKIIKALDNFEHWCRVHPTLYLIRTKKDLKQTIIYLESILLKKKYLVVDVTDSNIDKEGWLPTYVWDWWDKQNRRIQLLRNADKVPTIYLVEDVVRLTERQFNSIKDIDDFLETMTFKSDFDKQIARNYLIHIFRLVQKERWNHLVWSSC